MNSNDHLPTDIAEGAPVARRMIKVAILCVLMAVALWLATAAFANEIYLPNVSQRCGNPCAHSVPMPTVTSTPDIGQPPMPTMEANQQ